MKLLLMQILQYFTEYRSKRFQIGEFWKSPLQTGHLHFKLAQIQMCHSPKVKDGV